MKAVVIATAIRLLHPEMPQVKALTYARIIEREVATTRDLSPLLVVALIEAESTWDPKARNKKSRASGLMQIAPCHWPKRKKLIVFTPPWNIKMGVKLLDSALRRCRYTWEAFESYNQDEDTRTRYSMGVSVYNGQGSCKESGFGARVWSIMNRIKHLEPRA
jgi:hypothetical protein